MGPTERFSLFSPPRTGNGESRYQNVFTGSRRSADRKVHQTAVRVRIRQVGYFPPPQSISPGRQVKPAALVVLDDACLHRKGKRERGFLQLRPGFGFAEATSVLPLMASYLYHQEGWKKRRRRRYTAFLDESAD